MELKKYDNGMQIVDALGRRDMTPDISDMVRINAASAETRSYFFCRICQMQRQSLEQQKKRCADLKVVKGQADRNGFGCKQRHDLKLCAGERGNRAGGVRDYRGNAAAACAADDQGGAGCLRALVALYA